MDGAKLSPRERRILAEIEEDLCTDTGLARALGSGRPRRRFRLGSGTPTGWGAALLAPLAVVLLVTAVATEAPALIWSFAVVWVLTLVCLMRLLLRWSRRHLTGDERPRRDEDDGSPPTT
ncbi:DUF3040 domain-containing protein [Streptomyces sp. NPDC127092]|uniref:DUF3040 domain-containing protein n=1 Tax=Streptomyces sp. NPDC127092 TaxID=3347135 RepID=UPI0036560EEE